MVVVVVVVVVVESLVVLTFDKGVQHPAKGGTAVKPSARARATHWARRRPGWVRRRFAASRHRVGDWQLGCYCGSIETKRVAIFHCQVPNAFLMKPCYLLGFQAHDKPSRH